MSPEAQETLKILAPYLALGASAIGGVLGYGKVKAIVETWGETRREDNKRHEEAVAALRRDVDKALDEQRRAVEENAKDINGIGRGLTERFNQVNREIGEVRGEALGRVNGEQHRIDEHAKRTALQQTQNAEYFAQQAKERMVEAEELVASLKAQLEKAR